MRKFVELFDAVDATTSTLKKVDALKTYFNAAPKEDAAWALFFLSGRKIKRLVGVRALQEAALQASGVSRWMFDECYATVGDLAETIALLIETDGSATDAPSLTEWVVRIQQLSVLSNEEQAAFVLALWKGRPAREIFLLNKLMTGGFRAGVSQLLVARALAEIAGIAEPAMAQRLMGDWRPDPDLLDRLLSQDGPALDVGTPYPFFLASPLEGGPETLGNLADWAVEWKWDGIRAQAVRRAGTTFLWSLGEELIGERFPEIAEAVSHFPDGTVVDGELLAWKDGNAMPFSELQKRIGRKKLTPKILSSIPVAFVAFDLLEDAGVDLRECAWEERRRLLEKRIAPMAPLFLPSPVVDADSWDRLAILRGESRTRRVEGFMLKRKSSPYRTGRRRGDWWKWKIDPYTMDAVLMYAQAGHGRRSTLYTDYTFGVWRENELVPVAKAYSGLTDAEISELDRWIRKNTVEKFGPVRSVPYERVFEIAFEGIGESPRHKSGIAVRFPRILRERTDKRPADADNVERLRLLFENSAT